MVVDWTGTNPQVKGAINNTLSFTKAASYTGIRSVLPPDIPNNEGVFRAIEVICPPGTVGNGVLPAACAARGLTGFRMVDCMFGALAMMLPDKVKAAGDGGNTGISIGGYDADRKPFIYVDFTCGAWGARPWADGLDGNSPHVRQHGLAFDRGDRGRAADPAAGLRVRCRQGRRRQVSRRRAVPARLPLPRGRGRCCRSAPTGATTGRSASMAAAPARPSENYLNPQAENRVLPGKFTMTIKQGRRLPPRAGRRRRLGRSAGARSGRGAEGRAQRAAVGRRRPPPTTAWSSTRRAGRSMRPRPPARREEIRRARGWDATCPRCSGTIRRRPAGRGARPQNERPLSRRRRHRRHLHRHRAARRRRHDPHQEDLVERRQLRARHRRGPRASCSPRPGWPAARSRRSATARPSPPTPSSSTRARGSG